MVRLVDLCIGSKGTRAVKSLPSVSLYMRTTDEKDRRRYERIRRRNPQICGPKGCVLPSLLQAREAQVVERWNRPEHRHRRARPEGAGAFGPEHGRSNPVQTISPPHPSHWRIFERYLSTTKRPPSKGRHALHPNTIRSFEVVTRGFLDTIEVF